MIKTIGVISDTHNFINPKVFSVFEGVELIFHAGDTGTENIITSLETIAPVQAVYGNVDTFPIITRYPEVFSETIEGIKICMLHQFTGMNSDLILNASQKLRGELDIVIFGHSHRASLQREDNTFLFNPGAAGKKRFSLKPAVGLIKIINPGQFVPEIIYLD